MSFNTRSCLLAVLTAVSLPALASNPADEACMKMMVRVASFSAAEDGEMRIQELFPETHPLHAIKKFETMSDARKLHAAAMEEDLRPEVRLLVLNELNCAYSGLIEVIDSLEEINSKFRKDFEGMSDEEQQRVLGRVKNFEEGFSDFHKCFEPADLKDFNDAVKMLAEAKNKAQLLEGISAFEKALKGMRTSLEAKQQEIRPVLFDLLLRAPQMCPQEALGWRTRTLSLGHRYLTHVSNDKVAGVLQVMDDICRQLSGELVNMRRHPSARTIMHALFSPWKIAALTEAYKDNRDRVSEHLLPVAAPMAALYFTWSSLYFSRILKTNDGNSELVREFYEKALKSAEILETEDTAERGPFEFRAMTQGMSRLLAIELLQFVGGDLLDLHAKKLISDEDLAKYRAGLAAKARDLAKNMVFDINMGHLSKLFQSKTYLRLASLQDDVLIKFMCYAAADKVYQTATYRDPQSDLLSRFDKDGVIERASELEDVQKMFADKVVVRKEQAYQEAMDRVKGFMDKAAAQEDVLEKISMLSQARVLYSMARHISQSQEVLDLEETLDNAVVQAIGVFKASCEGQLEGLKAELVQNTTPELLGKLYALCKEIPKKANDAAKAAEELSSEFKQIVHFGWKYKDHTEWNKLETLRSNAMALLKDQLKLHLEGREVVYRKLAEAGEDAAVLAEQYAGELIQLHGIFNGHAGLWGPSALVLELRMMPHYAAIRAAKSVGEVCDVVNRVEPLLAAQRDAYPPVFNDLEDIIKDEVQAENRRRQLYGQRPITRAEYGRPDVEASMRRNLFGFGEDKQGWLPAAWMKALESVHNKLKEEATAFAQVYKPALHGLDNLSFEHLSSELFLLDQWKNPRNQMCQTEEGVAGAFVQKVLASFKQVNWDELTPRKYDELVKKVREALPWTTSVLTTAFFGRIHDLMRVRVLSNVAALPVETLLAEIEYLPPKLTADEKAQLEKIYGEKINQWAREKREAIRVLNDAIKVDQDLAEKIAHCDQLMPLMRKFKQTRDDYFVLSESNYRYKMGIRVLGNVIPMEELLLPCSLAEILSVRETARQDLQYQGIVGRFEAFKQRAKQAKDSANPKRAYWAILDESTKFLEELRKYQEWDQVLKLRGQLEQFIKQLREEQKK